MHLCKKWSKYAFAYASMQMHNYPKPSYNPLGYMLKSVFSLQGTFCMWLSLLDGRIQKDVPTANCNQSHLAKMN